MDFFLYLCYMNKISIFKSSLFNPPKEIKVYLPINRTIRGVDYMIPILFNTYYGDEFMTPNLDSLNILDDIIRILNNYGNLNQVRLNIYIPIDFNPTMRYLQQNLPEELR